MQFRRAMRRHFSNANLRHSPSLRDLVRAASKMSIQALAAETGGTEEDAGKIITVGSPLNLMGVHMIWKLVGLGPSMEALTLLTLF